MCVLRMYMYAVVANSRAREEPQSARQMGVASIVFSVIGIVIGIIIIVIIIVMVFVVGVAVTDTLDVNINNKTILHRLFKPLGLLLGLHNLFTIKLILCNIKSRLAYMVFFDFLCLFVSHITVML